MSPVQSLRTRWQRLVLSVAATVLLASCGGGDPYTGLWLGWVAPEREATTIMLEDGRYYMLYKKPGFPWFAGVIEGTGEFKGATFSSAKARDYNWPDPTGFGTGTREVSLSAKIGGHMTATGSVNGPVVGNQAFSVAYDKDFDGDARVAALEGAFAGWAVFALGPRPATFTVKNGAVSSVVNGCELTGKVVARMDTNAYDLTLKFGGAPCDYRFVGAELSGVVVYREDVKQLQAAIVHGSRTQAMAFSGKRVTP